MIQIGEYHYSEYDEKMKHLILMIMQILHNFIHFMHFMIKIMVKIQENTAKILEIMQFQ